LAFALRERRRRDSERQDDARCECAANHRLADFFFVDVVTVVGDVDDEVGVVVEVDVGVVVDVDDVVPATSVAACVCACVVAAVVSAVGRSFLIAWPRLIGSLLLAVVVVAPVVVPVVVPPVVVPVVVPPVVVPPVGVPVVVPPVVVPPVGVPATGVLTMAAFRSANGMFRFCETCSAARNWP
jgi:hypothetical protein